MAKVIKHKAAVKQAETVKVAQFRGGLAGKGTLLKRDRSILLKKRDWKRKERVLNSGEDKFMVFDDYFQSDTEDAQRQQVEWVKDHLNIGSDFFTHFLKVEPAIFSGWLARHRSLRPEQREHLADLWHTILHLMSFMNSDTSQVKKLLRHQVAPEARSAIRLPEWTGTSMLNFLEQAGPPATRVVDEYVTAFRFGDLYASAK